MTYFTHSLAILIGIDAYANGISPLAIMVTEDAIEERRSMNRTTGLNQRDDRSHPIAGRLRKVPG